MSAGRIFALFKSEESQKERRKTMVQNMEVMLTLPDEIAGIPLSYQGKIRGMYSRGSVAVMVVTDRISAFDEVLANGVPYKGAVLAQLAAWWFGQKFMRPNHYLGLLTPETQIELLGHEIPPEFHYRSMVVRRAQPLQFEAVVRGYLFGTGWAQYQKSGKINGIRLPEGLKEGDKLPKPIFTPTTKALAGDHDMPITFDELFGLIGLRAAQAVRDKAIRAYLEASERAFARGVVIADTKFEFGWILGTNGKMKLVFIDEALTPDSSRFWPLDGQVSLDKQFVRNWLQGEINAGRWVPGEKPPALPKFHVQETTTRYLEIFRRLTGHDILM